MAWAICENCKIAIEWFAGRGFKLAYLECPLCKGKLKGCSFEKALEITGCKDFQELREGNKYFNLRVRW
jgi:hypothetical protein